VEKLHGSFFGFANFGNLPLYLALSILGLQILNFRQLIEYMLYEAKMIGKDLDEWKL